MEKTGYSLETRYPKDRLTVNFPKQKTGKICQNTQNKHRYSRDGFVKWNENFTGLINGTKITSIPNYVRFSSYILRFCITKFLLATCRSISLTSVNLSRISIGRFSITVQQQDKTVTYDCQNFRNSNKKVKTVNCISKINFIKKHKSGRKSNYPQKSYELHKSNQ